MNKMLPSPSKSLGRLSDVLTSSVLACLGKPNPLGLSKVSSTINVLVDGLGYHQLKRVSGHAPSLANAAKSISANFPATTATNIKSYATGMRPNQHGFLGYRMLHEHGLSNLLADLDKFLLDSFDREPTIMEGLPAQGLKGFVVASEEYRNTGFTKVTMRGAEFVAAETIEQRLETAKRLAQTKGSVIYCYIPELDKTGHKEGWGSDTWLMYLESLESAVKKLDLARNIGLTLTADHGMINTSADLHIRLEQYIEFEELTSLAGDTRVSYLYTHLSVQEISDRLEGVPISVFSAQELEDAGWFGGRVNEQYRGRLPQVVLIAAGKHIILHSGYASPRAYALVGHHGAFTPDELDVPLVRINF